MADEWFVRVHEKEYGPVDLETLLEWKAEGRLIPENEVRTSADAPWRPAAVLPELFPLPESTHPEAPEIYRRRSLSEIIAETFRLYARG
ncbi:MAG TPA: DUF4339 domain-containing protein, partial [Chthoniobacterales bacterium]